MPHIRTSGRLPRHTLTFAGKLLAFWLLCVLPVTGPAAETPLRIVAFGDSLVAGYGVQPSHSFPAQLRAMLTSRGHAVKIVNAGVSGDTTAKALGRINTVVRQKPDIVIVVLGGNDTLRRVPPARTHRNLSRILASLKQTGAVTVLSGMQALPQHPSADRYIFHATYPQLAEHYGAILHPFFLEGVAGNPALNLRDGVHPNGQGIAHITRGITPYVEQAIARVKQQRHETESEGWWLR